MRLSKMKLKNFRCFGPEETEIDFDKLTTIIGNNSVGKTAVLHAILKMFGDTREKEITRGDFHVPINQSPNEIKENSFTIEVKFDFPELAEGKEEYAVPLFFESFVVSSPGSPPYLRVLLEASWKDGSDPEGIIEYKYSYIIASDEEELQEELQEEHYKPMTKHDRSNIKVIYVPAVRNPTDQLRNASGTILWRILKGVNWTDSDEESIKTGIAAVDTAIAQQAGIAQIKDIIGTQWKQYHSDDRYTKADIKFGSTDLESILKKLEVEFTPTQTERAFSVNDLGDGLRSLFYLTLVDSLLEIENVAIQESIEEKLPQDRIMNIEPPALSIILVEEPENHISPHLLGKVIGNLRRIASKSNSQTIITSHSPSIVKKVDPVNIRHVRFDKQNEKTVVNRIKLPDKASDAFKYIKEAVQAYPELYFSSLVILGEGDSEEIIIPKFMNLSGENIDSREVSVVPLGGRHVNHFWKLLQQLGIPYITLLDLDRERFGGGWGRIQYVLKQLIKLGVDQEDLLKLNSGAILSETQLNGMIDRGMSEEFLENQKEWCNRLEEYNVYFSSPLDIDFLMLESFIEYYKMTLSGKEGPYIDKLSKAEDIKVEKEKNPDYQNRIKIIEITEEQKEDSTYQSRVKDDIRKTLKTEGGDGITYTDEQKELMIWYSYFFLGRGKPSTHILGLSKIEDDLFMSRLPEVFQKIISTADRLLTNVDSSKLGDS